LTVGSRYYVYCRSAGSIRTSCLQLVTHGTPVDSRTGPAAGTTGAAFNRSASMFLSRRSRPNVERKRRRRLAGYSADAERNAEVQRLASHIVLGPQQEPGDVTDRRASRKPRLRLLTSNSDHSGGTVLVVIFRRAV
jgi:hypothetical protein